MNKPGVEETFPHSDAAVWFKVMGKMFAMTFVKPFTYLGDTADPFTFVNLKCEPQRAEELRASFPAIQPGWHQSKKHWNSVFMDGTLEDSFFMELIDHSYDIVVATLPKKVQQELQNP